MARIRPEEIRSATRETGWTARPGHALKGPLWTGICPIGRRDAAQAALQAEVSEQAAKRFFADEDPLGKIIRVDNSNYGSMYKITGIMQDMSKRAHFRLDFMVAGASPDASI